MPNSLGFWFGIVMLFLAAPAWLFLVCGSARKRRFDSLVLWCSGPALCTAFYELLKYPTWQITAVLTAGLLFALAFLSGFPASEKNENHGRCFKRGEIIALTLIAVVMSAIGSAPLSRDALALLFCAISFACSLAALYTVRIRKQEACQSRLR